MLIGFVVLALLKNFTGGWNGPRNKNSKDFHSDLSLQTDDTNAQAPPIFGSQVDSGHAKRLLKLWLRTEIEHNSCLVASDSPDACIEPSNQSAKVDIKSISPTISAAYSILAILSSSIAVATVHRLLEIRPFAAASPPRLCSLRLRSLATGEERLYSK